MQTLATRAGPATLLTLAHALRAAAAGLARIAHDLDAWLALRAKTASDRATLAQMNDRELKDIGVSRGYLNQVATGAWSRDV
ncbi:MAG: DUF1127 domain-containing protein [Burkholderiales bacterium]|nr:DUF1127 domain-containing protein [Burkholderiales bacterium]GIK86839.1 MAG: hypothetical protein BroJett026_23200 [Betaproteobacteria bacterium]